MPAAPAPTDWPTLASLMRTERERRKSAGEPYGTLADVSEAAKVTIAAVANWETGVDFPTRENFVRWMTILDRRQWIALYDDLAATEAMLRSARRHRDMSKEDEARIRAAMSRGRK